jgi:hypothetical protein
VAPAMLGAPDAQAVRPIYEVILMATKKSPIKTKPIHVAGQSLEYRIEEIITDIVAEVIFVAIIIACAVNEWIHWFIPMTFPPYATSILALIAVVIFILKIVDNRRKLANYRLGQEGERVVAEKLNRIIKAGSYVLHDIVGNNFNLDHVIISTKGIFIIETKTVRKYKNEQISYLNGQLFAGKRLLGKINIDQAKWGASWLKNKIEEITDKKIFVKPVLVFPGWFVNPIPNEVSEQIWILNPENIYDFIKNKPDVLNESEVKLITCALVSYIRVNQ